jgi:hypothetical protein
MKHQLDIRIGFKGMEHGMSRPSLRERGHGIGAFRNRSDRKPPIAIASGLQEALTIGRQPPIQIIDPQRLDPYSAHAEPLGRHHESGEPEHIVPAPSTGNRKGFAKGRAHLLQGAILFRRGRRRLFGRQDHGAFMHGSSMLEGSENMQEAKS